MKRIEFCIKLDNGLPEKLFVFPLFESFSNYLKGEDLTKK